LSFPYIELNRTFRKLTTSEQTDAEVDYQQTTGTPLTWDDLLQEHRVVILSEAGSGKTCEIRQMSQKLRLEGKSAFFMRLEHIAVDFEMAFEEGTVEEFEDWLISLDEGWFFLDSVDEARLRHPQDFELAILRFVARLKASNLQRSRIVITSRGSAWRPATDLALCVQKLPCSKPDLKKPEDTFCIVALDNLNLSHVRLFAEHAQTSQVDQLLEEITRLEYEHMVSRPEDLIELLQYWNAHQQLSNRQEMLEYSIRQRLKERDQTRAETHPLSEAEAWDGAKWVAAAATLTHQSTIRVPDGIHNQAGLCVQRILPEWDERKCATLLSRPIFDEAIYETVRFHHRSVREYLTAKWFKALIDQHTSHHKIEQLFFRRQYGIEVIVPNMRPILSWLIIWDDRLLKKAIQLSPEMLFDCAEPQLLPVEYRKKAVEDICEKMTTQVVRGVVQDYQKLQRFAAPDLVDDVRALLQKHQHNDEVKYFLLLLIWRGKLQQLVPEAYQIATDQTCQRDTRIAAYQVVISLAAPIQQQELRHSFLQQPNQLDRREFAELIHHLPDISESIDWLIACLKKVKKAEESSGYDNLAHKLNKFVKEISLPLNAQFLQDTYLLFTQKPFIEPQYCQISKKYAWLGQSISSCLEKIILIKSDFSLQKYNLSFLQKLSIATLSYAHELHLIDKSIDFKSLVRNWPELNHRLFWYVVNQKKLLHPEQRITKYYQVNSDCYYSDFTSKDFNDLLDQISIKNSTDDKLIILSILISLLNEEDKYQKIDKISIAIKGITELETELHALLTPSALTTQQMIQNRKIQRYKKKAHIRKIRNRVRLIKARIYARKNLNLLSPTKNGDSISQLQNYLLNKTTDHENHSWGYGDWKSLQPFFGHDIAQAFRDGLVAYWRLHKAQLRSEGKPSNSTPYTTILGLTGLTIQAREEPDWYIGLTTSEVELAFRYAMNQLNGFPVWFDQLYQTYSDHIAELFNIEISYYFQSDENEFSYIIGDLSHHPSLIHPKTTEHLFALLAHENPKGIKRLEQSLEILLKTANTARLADLAQQNVQQGAPHLSLWFALLVSTQPVAAFELLKAFIEQLPNAQDKLDFCQNFIHYLMGGRFNHGKFFSPALRNATVLKNLFLLMHQYIKKSDDINRAGGGVYSPTLRDHAQDARDGLFNLLKDLEGKDTYIALKELATEHPDPTYQPWMAHHALEHAERDATQTAWAIQDVLDFQNSLDRMPSTGQELFELVNMRLGDLKHELEQGDSSISKIINEGVKEETDMRVYIGDWMRKCAHGRYSIPQEEELADAVRPDFRVHGAGVDLIVPIELKLAERWTGNNLFERLENQLAGDYLRDSRSQYGIFLLVYKDRSRKKNWDVNSNSLNFTALLDALQQHWYAIQERYSNIQDIQVIGIDLSARYL
jgi:hypothetical protein